jgi:hypothetical protein
MDSLEQMIQNLKKEEIRAFKILTNRFKRADDVKIAILFDKIRSQKYDNEEEKLVAELFPDDPKNMNAYYRLKNRLKTELEKSLLNLHHNLDDKITTVNLITLSSLFTYKGQYELAFHYLRRAEKIAQQNGYYDLLNFVYNDVISMSNRYNEINPIEYIEKLKDNADKSMQMLQVNRDFAALRFKLRKTNFARLSGDVGETLTRIQKELNISSEMYLSPDMKFKVHNLIRSSLLQNKEFQALETYLIHSLHEFESEGLFNKNSHRSKINLITWIINTLTINKNWAQSIHYTDMLYEELHKYNKLNYDNFIWTYYQSQVTNWMSTGQLDKAINLLQEIKDSPVQKPDIVLYGYFINGNLALGHYFSGSPSLAIKTLSMLFAKDVYPKLATEFQFSFSLLDAIFHFENHSLDFASYRIGEMKRQFRAILKRPEYQEEKSFLKILSYMCNKPDPLKDKLVVSHINEFISKASGLQVGSSKHIDYGLWLKAKLKRRSYYESLLEMLRGTDAVAA